MIKYRPEIDGLRALAVIPVILFHAGFSAFSGGFIGVDVFFVISGYLITSIILKEYKNKNFSFINFYERRARRILPALFFIIAVTFPFAWLWMSPDDLREFGGSAAAVTVFGSNFFFWKKTGYFETAAEMKPLLHTWSLAVEEQFYLLFPLCLILLLTLLKSRPSLIMSIMLAAAIISLGLAEWGSRNEPIASFFLLPTRGWELLIGILIAFSAHYFPDKVSAINGKEITLEIGSILGLGMIIASILLYSVDTPFPGFYALVPTLGTALIIQFCTPNTLVGRILCSKLFVGIGLISYSAYLWHQPIFALARHRSLVEPAPETFLLLSALSLALAAGTWRFIEQPFRQKKRIARKHVVQFSMASAIFIAITGWVFYSTNGFERHWHASLTGITKTTYELVSKSEEDLGRKKTFGECRFPLKKFSESEVKRLKHCFEKHGPGLAILGDSHAMDLYGAINRNLDSPFIVSFAKGGCRPHAVEPKCLYDKFLDFIQENPKVFSHAIFEQAGFYLFTDDQGQNGNRKFFNTFRLNEEVPDYRPHEPFINIMIDYLHQISQSIPVLWLGPRLDPHISLKQILKLGCDYQYQLRPNLHNVYKSLDNRAGEMVDAANTTNLTYISQIDNHDFDIKSELVSCDVLYWRNGDHWTAQGEQFFGNHIADLIQREISIP
ncbi:MAG: acyltransferase [Candidatus Thiodiazotropha endolucinida]|nr:acyltransferase [Candidatus Thiodiazotropha taylori]MCG8096886.1 acyltransferase [Candidatus Thiodiazotropha endolucinida]MCG8046594.1 acyltransferase [Candidatus Thiodiazotropha taylori]MCG8052430.1 acyltransferase [Candidatus Thiodiazotropha taylori]MCG8070917.1 acyltransferase [Candidatus Thiodiazotropha taylori]